MKTSINTNVIGQNPSIARHLENFSTNQSNTIQLYTKKLKTASIDEYIAICLILENQMADGQLKDIWVSALEKFNNSKTFRTYYDEYLLRSKNLAQRNSNKVFEKLNLLFQEKSYVQVVQQYKNNTSSFENNSDALQIISAACMQIDDFELAKVTAQKATIGFELPKLNTIGETLMSKYKTAAKLETWKKSMQNKSSNKVDYTEDFDNWFDYSLSLIEDGEFNKSEKILNLLVKNIQGIN